MAPPVLPVFGWIVKDAAAFLTVWSDKTDNWPLINLDD